MAEILAKQYKDVFVHNVLHSTWLDKKLDKLRTMRKNELRNLKEVIPLQRIEIRERAEELYRISEEYREMGFDRLYRRFMNQASVVIKSLMTINRYHTMRLIHRINRHIREIKARIELDDQSQESNKYCLKETLYRDFVSQYIQERG